MEHFMPGSYWAELDDSHPYWMVNPFKESAKPEEPPTDSNDQDEEE